MRCPHCHRKIPDQAVYCGACGRRVAGWEGDTRGGGRPASDSREDTERVRPDSSLLRAAGRDSDDTRRLDPDSELLRVVRGAPTPTPPEALGQSPEPAARQDDEAGRDDPTDVITTGIQSRVVAAGSETAFLIGAALRRNRSRLVLLMVANACLLGVGIYLIVTWTKRREQESLRPGATAPPRARGYVNWDDDGTGSIANAPVQATFPTRPKPSPMVMKPPEMDAPKPKEMDAPKPKEMDAPKPKEMDAPKPPPKRPADDEQAQARRRAARRRAFLRQVAPRVRARQRDVHRCYQQTLSLLGRFRGFLDVEFQVGPDGRVVRARATRNTTGSKALGSCIVAVIKSIRFPRPPDGTVSLLYPFRFRSGKR